MNWELRARRIGWPAILIALLALLVMVIPAVDGSAPAESHGYCPLHTNPVIVAGGVALPTAAVILLQHLGGQPCRLPAVPAAVFIPPRS